MARKLQHDEAIRLIKESCNYYSAFCITPIVGKKDQTVIWTGKQFYLAEPNEFSITIRDVNWRDGQPRVTYEIIMEDGGCAVMKEISKSLQEEVQKLKIGMEGDRPILYNRHPSHKDDPYDPPQ